MNRRMFDETHRRPGEGRAALPPIVKQTLGDLAGKRVLHLHCGTGEGSAELAEQGAVVTAIDPDEGVLDAARERWPKILWVPADAQELRTLIRNARREQKEGRPPRAFRELFRVLKSLDTPTAPAG